MQNVTPITKKQDIKEQACVWISRIDRGLSEEEKQRFADWVSQSKQHKEIVLSMASLWDDLSVLNELSSLFPLKEKEQQKKLSVSPVWYSIAAVVFLCVMLLLVLPAPPQEVELTKISTSVGQQVSRTLDDGSLVHLNTNTEIQIAYTDKHRQLILVRGEAQFDVAPDKERPFSVNAGQRSFTALGTIFNVKKLTDQPLELVVTEGRVLINEKPAKAQAVRKTLNSPQTPADALLVHSGEKAVFNNGQPAPVLKVSEQQVEKDLAWMHGMLIFDGDPLVDALEEVSRYTSTEFRISDPELAQIKVAGYFKAGDVKGLLNSLQSNFAISHHKIAKNVIKLESTEI